MNTGVPAWVEGIVAALLIISGVMVFISAIGLVRLRNFFVRMHPPALAYTGATWSATLAAALYFSAVESRPVLKPLLIVIFLFMVVPVTSLLLARVVLFRNRAARAEGTPPPLTRAP